MTVGELQEILKNFDPWLELEVEYYPRPYNGGYYLSEITDYYSYQDYKRRHVVVLTT